MIHDMSIGPPRIATIAAWAIWTTLAAFSSGCIPLVVGAAGGAAGVVYVMGKSTRSSATTCPLSIGPR